MSLGVKGGAVLYRRKQKARKMEDYSRYMEKLVNGSVIVPNGKEGEGMPWWTEDRVADNNGEKNMSEQTKAIGRDIRIGLDTGMPARVKEIKEWLASNCGQWEERLTHSFEGLFQMGKEKEVSYLQVCFLRTSLLTGGYFYRACFYDSLYYLDPEPVCIDVDTWFVYQFFQEDVEGCIQKLQGRYKRLCPNDIMKIKELCNFYYIGLMKMCVEAILPGLLETKAYKGSKKAENFRILFGEYMGKAEVIYGLFYSDTR